MIKVYEAFINAGADKEHASEATRELEKQILQMEELRGDIRLLKWMVGTNVGISIGMLLLILNFFVRLP